MSIILVVFGILNLILLIKVINACKTIGQVFKDDFKLGKDFKMGQAWAIILFIFFIWKSTLPKKVMMHVKTMGQVFFFFNMISSWAKSLKWVKHEIWRGYLLGLFSVSINPSLFVELLLFHQIDFNNWYQSQHLD